MQRRLLVAGLAVGGALLAWWLFGTSVSREAGTEVRMHRFFGRVTRVDLIYTDGTRTCRERYPYSWSEPFVEGAGCMTPCPLPPESWHDRNCDGRWDTWMYRRSFTEQGDCRVEYRVDTDDDGKPDWTFTKEFKDYQATGQEIKDRRGF